VVTKPSGVMGVSELAAMPYPAALMPPVGLYREPYRGGRPGNGRGRGSYSQHKSEADREDRDPVGSPAGTSHGVAQKRSEHKVPPGNSTYARAKHLQLVEKDLEAARTLFLEVVEEGRSKTESALKDLAVVLRQLGRPLEAVEAIQKYRYKCSPTAQMSLDNMLLEIYKHLRDFEKQIHVLERLISSLKHEQARTGMKVVTARNNSAKFKVAVEAQYAKLYSAMGWAYMQLGNWRKAEEVYTEGLAYASECYHQEDANMQVNRGVCLIRQGRLVEAQELLLRVTATARGLSSNEQKEVGGSHLATIRRATAALRELEGIYHQQLEQLQQSLQEQDTLHGVLKLLDFDEDLLGVSLPDECREASEKTDAAAPPTKVVQLPGPRGGQAERKAGNKGTSGKSRDGESRWFAEALCNPNPRLVEASTATPEHLFS